MGLRLADGRRPHDHGSWVLRAPRGRPIAALRSAEHVFDGSELNPEQLAAATHPGGPLLVLAGAGTGKTTTLCARVEWLLASGLAPERVLLLTFTRRAAREMLQRAAARTPAARRIVGGTIHDVAHRLGRPHASSVGPSGS